MMRLQAVVRGGGERARVNENEFKNENEIEKENENET